MRLAVLVALVTTLGLAASAQAAPIAVTNGNDDGSGSLRAAVAAANPGDTITIPALTVSLTSGQISILKNLTITGVGARQTTISGTGQSRIFAVDGGATVSLSGVTITGGNGLDHPGGTAGDGGAIDIADGSLTVADSTVTGNSNSGAGEGAGIASSGSLTVMRSTISHNDGPGSDRAGGIRFGGTGTLQVTDSTLAHNTLQSGGLGAAVYVNSAASATFTNDTMDLDDAGSSGSVLDLNGGGFSTTIANTIVVGGTSESCSRMPTITPTAGGNVEDQNLCKFTDSSDHAMSDPQLGTLQNNGGPTDTQLPVIGSLAIGAGVDLACLATDQRGVPRPQGAHCDSGAVERTTPTAGAPTLSNITMTGAGVTASANPVFLGGTYVYRYGTTTGYGSSTAPATLPAGVAAQPASAVLSGLSPGTTYHVQLVVTTPDGSASSPDVTFTTANIRAAVSRLRVSPRKFSLAGRRVHGRCVKPTKKNSAGAHCRRAIRLGVSYTLNVGGTVTFTLQRIVPGRKVGSRCVKPTAKNKRRPKCTRVVTMRGRITRAGKAGANRFTFNGRIGGHTLGPGSYRLSATPGGGKVTRVAFRIVS